MYIGKITNTPLHLYPVKSIQVAQLYLMKTLLDQASGSVANQSVTEVLILQ